jgi:hypothetical protein
LIDLIEKVGDGVGGRPDEQMLSIPPVYNRR